MSEATVERPPAFSRVIKRASFESMQRADEIVAAAEFEAAAIRRRAEEERIAEKERGYQDGLRKAAAERAEHAVRFVESCAAFLGRCETEVAELVFECVEATLGRFDDAERIRRLVHEVVNEHADRNPIRLRVHPDERFWAAEELKALTAARSELAAVEVAGDARLPLGGCVLESAATVIDASLPLQLAALRKSLLGI